MIVGRTTRLCTRMPGSSSHVKLSYRCAWRVGAYRGLSRTSTCQQRTLEALRGVSPRKCMFSLRTKKASEQLFAVASLSSWDEEPDGIVLDGRSREGGNVCGGVQHRVEATQASEHCMSSAFRMVSWSGASSRGEKYEREQQQET